MDDESPPAAPAAVYRHALTTRIWHWVTALCVIVLLGVVSPYTEITIGPFCRKSMVTVSLAELRSVSMYRMPATSSGSPLSVDTRSFVTSRVTLSPSRS